MSANLITGNLFKPIYAYQDADYQAGISGNVTSIMPVGSQMALSIEDANTIKADDGVLITKEGRRIQIDAGAIEEWSIPTGTQGATNYFIIGFHLYTDSNSAEVCETFVEQMENATDTIPEDTFREGSTEVYVSLGRVVQNGINLDSVTSLVQIAQSFEDVRNAIAQLNNDLGSKSSASAVTGNDAFSKIATLKTYVDSKHEIVTVTGVQGDTYKTLLNKVWKAIDMGKIRPASTLKLVNNPPANISRITSAQVQGTFIGAASNGVTFYTLMIENGTSGARQYTLTTSGLTVTDISNTVVNAVSIYIEY
jgi:hypothetical protein